MEALLGNGQSLFETPMQDLSVWKDIVIPLVSSLIGSIVGGLVAFLTSRHALNTSHANALNLQERARREAVRGFILGIHTEIRSLLETYQEEWIEDIKSLRPGDPFEYTYPITQTYFAVFESGASVVGQIPDDELRSTIIRIYTAARGIIDTHLYNNKLIEERSQIAAEPGMLHGVMNVTKEIRLQNAQAALNDYGINIKVNFEKVETLISQFNERLEDVLQKLETPDGHL